MGIISYAQNMEDVMLWRALQHVKKGFYVDVGAAWPDTDSVTKLFYLNDWSGINIEPNPDFYTQLCQQRFRDINIKSAISSRRQGSVELNLFPDTGLSTLNSGVAKGHVEGNFKCVKVKVSTSTLAEVLHANLPAGQEIHFLKIDVEGLEAEVIESNDWSVYRPWIIVVESTLPLSQTQSHDEWELKVIQSGYIFAYADGLNRFYVEDTHLDLLAAFKYPPNVFDQFVLASEVKALERQRDLELRAASALEDRRLATAYAAREEEARYLAEERAERAEAALGQVQERAERAESHVTALQVELKKFLASKPWRIAKTITNTAKYVANRKYRSKLQNLIDMIEVPLGAKNDYDQVVNLRSERVKKIVICALAKINTPNRI